MAQTKISDLKQNFTGKRSSKQPPTNRVGLSIIAVMESELSLNKVLNDKQFFVYFST